MDDEFRPDLNAHVAVDDDGKIRQVLHTDERWLPSEANPRRAAIEYVRLQAGLFDLAPAALERLHEPVVYTEPEPEGDSFRLAEEKQQFDTSTIAFAQTYGNVPVWRTGVTVTVKGGPARIVESTNTTLANVRAKLPSEETIARWRGVFAAADERQPATGEEQPAASPADRDMRAALGLSGTGTRSRAG